MKNAEQLKALAEEYETPLYVYDLEQLERNCQTMSQLLAHTKGKLLYAMMGNHHSQVLQIIKKC
jgi:diaminopimelate decarboxylase